MSTGIEYATDTWNPITGCQRASVGCTNCWAERLAATRLKDHPRYRGVAEMTDSGPRWTGEVRLHPELLEQPLRWRKPRRIFVCSMSDLFHPAVPATYIAAVFGVMAARPQHTFLILTKRPERMLEWFRWIDDGGYSPESLVADHLDEYLIDYGLPIWKRPTEAAISWPLPNVWLLTSIEDQRSADERIPHLLQTPAAVRGVSYEPALGPVDLAAVDCPGAKGLLDWVICGSESGPGRRETDIEWVRTIRHQCVAANVPFFLKQLHVDGKKVSMPELDGREWNEMPTTIQGGG